MTTQTLLSVGEFFQLPEQEGVIRELDEGKLIEMSPSQLLPHNIAASRLERWLGNHVEENGLELWVSHGAGFALGPEILRIPDVFVIQKSRAESMQQLQGGWLRGAPDLAIEVVSPADKALDLDRKVGQYLAAGSLAVWVAYPETRHFLAHHRNGETRDLRMGAKLTLPELLPGLAMDVGKIFHGL